MTEQELSEMSNEKLLVELEYICCEIGRALERVDIDQAVEYGEAHQEVRKELLRRLEHYNGKSI